MKKLFKIDAHPFPSRDSIPDIIVNCEDCSVSWPNVLVNRLVIHSFNPDVTDKAVDYPSPEFIEGIEKMMQTTQRNSIWIRLDLFLNKFLHSSEG